MTITNDKDNLQKILPFLPISFQKAFSKVDFISKESICEIRLRANLPTSLTLSGENMILQENGLLLSFSQTPLVLSEEDIAQTVIKLCGGSVYSYNESIRNGYITKFGFRVGLCGKMLFCDDRADAFSKFTSLNIRIPRHITDASKIVIEYISKSGFKNGGGILAISPPAAGKTTFLRSLSQKLSGGINFCGQQRAFRACIIDEREEIYLQDCFNSSLIDVLSSCPKAKGIEIATRVLSPEIIVLDEIGNENEALEILKAHTQGVIFLASCHGENISDVAKKPYMKELFKRGVFTLAYCMKRENEKITGKCEEIQTEE